MAEFIDPAIVPKVTLPSGEEVPCMGMGTFGSDRVSAEDVSAAVAENTGASKAESVSNENADSESVSAELQSQQSGAE